MNSIRTCPTCGNPLPPDAPDGLCPVCLLKTDLPSEQPTKGPDDRLGSPSMVYPIIQDGSPEPASTLTVNPAASLRLRYFGDYELQREIARGGMGVVWKARQSSLNRTVAVKMILAGNLAGEAEVRRFRREAEAAANLRHPNIVAIHEVGEHDGQHYYSMDFVEGRDLGALVHESGPLSPPRAAECVRTLAEAVHFAHQRGTLHRDLKPQNVLIDAAGVPRITDFGLAKFVESDESLTQTGAAMGSPSYMPPEQAAGQLNQVGPHSDVYALGAILYHLLTGQPPFRGETPVATMRQVMESDPVALRKLNPALPPDLETVCLKCLEKNPARRYHSARALAEELGRFLNHEPILALPASSVRKAENWLRRRPWMLMTAASLVAMVLLGLLYWQFERVKFLENRSLLHEQALRPAGVLGQELQNWKTGMSLLVSLLLWANFFFQRYALGMKNWKQVFNQPATWGPARTVSHRLRICCGMISLSGFGLTLLYLAKLIQVSVWEHVPKWSGWLIVYPASFGSLWLLFQVLRDYQKFVHGTSETPSGVLSPEQVESLRLAIFDRQFRSAIKLYQRTIPTASRREAQGYVQKLAVELMAKHPEKFAGPLDLNWRLMSVCLVVEVGLFTGFWMMRSPVTSPPRLLVFSAGFLFGAGLCLSRRLKARRAALAATLIAVLAPVAFLALGWFPSEAFFGGFAFGLCLILCGFTRKPTILCKTT